MEPERLGRRFAGAIYGTVVTAGVLVAAADEQPDAWDAALFALATVVVLWVAGAWARLLGRRASGAAGEETFRHSLADDWPLVLSPLPALIAVGLALLLGAGDEEAVDTGVWTCVIALGIWGGAVARRQRKSLPRILLAGLGTAMLGIMVVLLEALIH